MTLTTSEATHLQWDGITPPLRGRDLGPLAMMPTDLRKALYRLALELQRNK